MTKNQLVSSDSPVGFTVVGVVALAGGGGAVAKKCGISIQTVTKWGRRIPDRHAQTVAVMAGLPLEVVRPDLVQRGHAEANIYVGKLK
jgi:hypothetical protein